MVVGTSGLGVALRWRPEWPFALLPLAAWVALAAGLGGRASVPAPTAMHGMAMHGMKHAGHGSGLLPMLAGWALMSTGMMLPVVLPAVGYVGLNSLRARRTRAMAIFVGVYLGFWAAFGVVALVGVGWLRRAGIDDRFVLAGALAIAAVWQLL